VGIYGLVVQHSTTHKIRPIYVHSKLAIIDDVLLVNGSTNMDNNSFFYSSEVSAAIYNEKVRRSSRAVTSRDEPSSNRMLLTHNELGVVQLAKQTKDRLVREHLGDFYRPEMAHDFELVFEGFRSAATENNRVLSHKASAQNMLVARPVFMAPAENYHLVLKSVYYPNKLTKLLYKMGVDAEDLNDRVSMLLPSMPEFSWPAMPERLRAAL